MMIYVNGQDIAGIVLGATNGTRWLLEPELLQVRPEGYLAALENWLNKQQLARTEITGFVLVKGPGSATALRTSHALVNALAFALGVSVVSIEKAPEQADTLVIEGLQTHQPHPFALPTYAYAPNITKTNRDALKRKVV